MQTPIPRVRSLMALLVGIAVLAVFAVLGARPLRAQQLRGTVRDSASQAPIPSAVVIVLDSAGGQLRRNITNEGGQFAVTVPVTAQRLQVLRLGFRPRTVGISVAGGTVDVTIVRIPTLLERVNVADSSPCPKRSDRAEALGLWEQARAGLFATVVAREAHPAFLQRFDYYRIVGEERPTVLSQIVHADSALATRSFKASLSAEDYVRDGFRDASGAEALFYGPDADVLVEPAFAIGYCFHLAPPDARHPHHVGLAFLPARGKDGRIDIERTIWVDSAARSLADLTFKYLGLERDAAMLSPGGAVHFQSMPNGSLLIDRWSLQVAAPTAKPVAETLAATTNSSAPTIDGRRLELHEQGGELLFATWGDSSDWHAKLSTVRGTLTGKGALPVANQELRLVGTDYHTVTDGAGRFEIADLVPGRYHFSVPDSTLNSVGLEVTRAQSLSSGRAGPKSIFLSAYDGEGGAWGSFTICNVGSAGQKLASGAIDTPAPDHFKIEAELEDEIGSVEFWTEPGRKRLLAFELRTAPKRP